MAYKHPEGPYIIDTTKASMLANDEKAVIRSVDGRWLARLNAGEEISVDEYCAMSVLFQCAPDLLALARRLEAICDEEREAWSGQGDEIAAGIEATWTERLADVRAVITQATGGKAEG